jgi:hypothetical protein
LDPIGCAEYYAKRSPDRGRHPEEALVAKGIEKAKKDNKPKLSTKEKQKKKKEKKAAKGG